MFKNLLYNITNPFKEKIVVLMYHRIISLETDPWQLAVNVHNFEQHLLVIKKYCHVLPVSELLAELSNKKIQHRKICITFDDAYADNYLYAKPLLEKYGCPATFFIPTAYIGHTQPFWWDMLESIILHTVRLPPSVRISINSEIFEFELIETILNDEMKQKHKAWTWLDPAPTRRCELYLALWKRLQPLVYENILKILIELKDWSAYAHTPNADSLPMSNEQLKEICLQPLFEIGVHTATHPALSYHSKDTQSLEILNSKQYLQQLTDKPINSMAYPYGNYNETSLSIVKDNGLSVAFTTQPQAVTKASNPLLLGRFQVTNQNGIEFDKQLRWWEKGV